VTFIEASPERSPAIDQLLLKIMEMRYDFFRASCELKFIAARRQSLRASNREATLIRFARRKAIDIQYLLGKPILAAS
jgi:hypothetical protein